MGNLILNENLKCYELNNMITASNSIKYTTEKYDRPVLIKEVHTRILK